ncbi:hypothetical protein BCR42DRAFT_416340 [Absidia repens]|uniref:BRCT domain-containing protein n=1 Tax=Absidia repens TaxID=90262 RepID=A0A1X2IEF4_9FUNG|nr:hypothetical protein BCR42DRAFT_416340 [Absidia repens]
MSHKFKTLPSNTTSQIPTSRASLPVLNGRRRLVNRPSHQATIDTEQQSNSPSPLFQVITTQSTLSPQIPITPPTPYLNKPTSDLQRSSSPANLLNTAKDTANCLNGVVACLDIRTEDGDDVSQNFEMALKSMGAKTRKTFADTVTHLIYKNGSAINVKKALHNKCKIVNLLWITNCKSQGKRLPEDKYLIDRPENLVLAGAKRRKSMEPGRVKALILDDSSSLEDKRSEDTTVSKRLKPPAAIRSRIPASQRRKTVSHWETSAIIPREATNSHHNLANKPDMSLELGDLNFDFSDTYDTTSSPTSELLQRRKTDNHIGTEQRSISRSMRRLSFKEDTPSKRQPPPPPPVSQKPQVNKEIKAGFYIGKSHNSPSPSSTSASPSSSSTTTVSALSSSLPSLSSSSPALIRRRRRSLSNRTALASPSALSTSTTTNASTNDPFSMIPDKSKSSPISSPFLKPQPPHNDTYDDDIVNENEPIPTIVMTSMNEQTKKKCAMIIKKLGGHRLASSVDETTTHVIVGCQRRTQSVILGLLYGTWLVTPDWLLDSGKSNEYLDESSYEAILYFPRARAARRRDPLLPSTISIYIRSTTLPLDLAQQLVKKAGGYVVDNMKEADIVISRTSIDSDIMTVTENWLLDSIEHWRYLATNKYHPPSS